VSHRRQEKEALRREREEREARARAEQQRKRMVGYGAGGLLVIAAIVVVVVLAAGGGESSSASSFFPEGGDVAEQQAFDVEAAAAAAGCKLDDVKSEGREHTTADVTFKANPPMTGRHHPAPAEDGIYGADTPADKHLVHALEHGRVVVWVKPSVAEDARATIRAMSEQDDNYQTLLVRRQNMPYAVAATAWSQDPQPEGTGNLLGCPKWSPEVIDALRTFRDEHRGNGPEPIP
jgi:hypothetical protein